MKKKVISLCIAILIMMFAFSLIASAASEDVKVSITSDGTVTVTATPEKGHNATQPLSALLVTETEFNAEDKIYGEPDGFGWADIGGNITFSNYASGQSAGASEGIPITWTLTKGGTILGNTNYVLMVWSESAGGDKTPIPIRTEADGSYTPPGIAITTVSVGVPVDLPTAGSSVSTNDTASTATANTTVDGKITWSGNNGAESTWAAGDTPVATVVLKAGDGYDFAGLTKDGVSITGPTGATVTDVALSGNNKTATIEVTYADKVAVLEIASVDVAVTAPAAGATPQDSIVAGTGYIGTIEWAPTDNPFGYGQAYTATVTLTADGNYKFAAGMNTTTAQINSENSTSAVVSGGDVAGNKITITKLFDATTAATEIKAVTLNDVPAKPSIGGAVTNPTITSNTTGVAVSGKTDWTKAGTWTAGDTPTINVTLTANTGYVFTSAVTSAITGANIDGTTNATIGNATLSNHNKTLSFTLTYPELEKTTVAAPQSVTIGTDATTGKMKVTVEEPADTTGIEKYEVAVCDSTGNTTYKTVDIAVGSGADGVLVDFDSNIKTDGTTRYLAKATSKAANTATHNDSAAVSSVATALTQTTLTVVATGNDDVVYGGKEPTITVTITNTGTVAAVGVSANISNNTDFTAENLPDNVTIAANNGTATFTVKLNDGKNKGDYTFTATATATNAADVTSSVTTQKVTAATLTAPVAPTVKGTPTKDTIALEAITATQPGTTIEYAIASTSGDDSDKVGVYQSSATFDNLLANTTYTFKAKVVVDDSNNTGNYDVAGKEGDASADITTAQAYKYVLKKPADETKGVVTLNPPDGSVLPGKNVTISIVPKAGFEVNTVSVATGEGNISGSDNDWTYTAPAAELTTANKDVALTVTYKAKTLTFGDQTITAGKVGEDYAAKNQAVTAPTAGGSGNYEYSSENLPNGLTLGTDGKFSGTPKVAGDGVTFAVKVKDTTTLAEATATYTITIAKGDQKATAVTVTGADSLEYGKDVSGVSVALDQTALGVDPVYSSSDTAIATVDAATGAITIVKPGTFKITATIAESTNYNGTVATLESSEITIGKKQLELSKNVASAKTTAGTEGFTFVDSSFIQDPAGLIALADASADLEYALGTNNVTGAAMNGNKLTWGAADAEQSATINVTMKENDYYTLKANAVITFTIADKDDATVTLQGAEITYGETTPVWSPQVTGATGTSSFTFSYSKKNEGNFTAAVPTSAGEYQVKATLVNDNFQGEAVADFTIQAKPITMKYASATKVYGDAAIAYGDVSLDGSEMVAGDDFDTLKASITPSCTASAVNTAVGSNYVITADGLDNYAITVSTKASVTQAPITVIGTVTKDYDGNTNKGSATVALTSVSGVNGETIAITDCTGSFNDKDVAAANSFAVDGITFNVTEGNASIQNYSFTGPQNVTGKINPLALTVTGKTSTSKGATKVSSFVTVSGALSNETIDNLFGTITNDVENEKGVKLTVKTTGDTPGLAVLPLASGKYTYSFSVNKTTFEEKNTNYIITDPAITDQALSVSGSSGGGGSSSGSSSSKSTEYTVTYSVGSNGTLDGDKTEKVVKDKTPSNLPKVTAKEGYRFLGWSTDGKTIVDPEDVKITKNTTFTALYEKVGAIDHLVYIQGMAGGLFTPNGNLTRAEAVTMLDRLHPGFEDKAYENKFSDVTETDWFFNYVTYGANNGIVEGYEDGGFQPNATITRGEFAAMLSRFAGLTAEGSTEYADVNGHWAAGNIAALQTKGIVDGYEDGSFRPNQTITRAEAVKMINGAIGRTPDKAKIETNLQYYTNPFSDVAASHWAYYEILEAAIAHYSGDFH